MLMMRRLCGTSCAQRPADAAVVQLLLHQVYTEARGCAIFAGPVLHRGHLMPMMRGSASQVHRGRLMRKPRPTGAAYHQHQPASAVYTRIPKGHASWASASLCKAVSHRSCASSPKPHIISTSPPPTKTWSAEAAHHQHQSLQYQAASVYISCRKSRTSSASASLCAILMRQKLCIINSRRPVYTW